MYIKSFFLALFTLLLLHCNAQKNNDSSNAITEKSSDHHFQKIELEEMTRGSRRMIVITQNSKEVEINRKITTLKTTETEWKNLQKLITQLNPEKIESFTPSTNKRFYDGAMAATIRVNIDGTVYSSQTFDAGNPPEQLATLYRKLVSSFKE